MPLFRCASALALLTISFAVVANEQTEKTFPTRCLSFAHQRPVERFFRRERETRPRNVTIQA